MAKSNRRKGQDRVRAGAKRAEQARRRVKAEREQQAAGRYRCLLDPRTSPADVAGILAAYHTMSRVCTKNPNGTVRSTAAVTRFAGVPAT